MSKNITVSIYSYSLYFGLAILLRCSLIFVTHECVYGMPSYSASELRQLRRNDVMVARLVRKTIFSHRLWCPRQVRERRFEHLEHQKLPEISNESHEDISIATTIKNTDNSTVCSTLHEQRTSLILDESPPSVYVLNAASLAKLHAIEQLTADLTSFNVDTAFIAETHFKSRHTDSVVAVDGYTLYRRDRTGRRGGGVAVYVRSTIKSSEWNYRHNDRMFELQWVRLGINTFVGSLYHPPKPVYQATDLLEYIEGCVEEICLDYPSAIIMIAGDFNQLPDQDLQERTGLLQIVHQPTRGSGCLDRIYVSHPLYNSVSVVASVVKSDHKAIIAFSDTNPCRRPKTVTRKTHRPVTPGQHAQFLHYAASNCTFTRSDDVSCTSTQSEFDEFYNGALDLLNRFYPERTVTVSSRDPEYITPGIKARLRRKNRLMRAGRVEEAGALATRIGKDIACRNRTRLTNAKGRMAAKDVWSAIRQLTGRTSDVGSIDGVSAESLNAHYASISTDSSYSVPLVKSTVAPIEQQQYISEWQVFQVLGHLHPTATGMDKIPAWFLRVGAPVFCEPLARLFNLSLATSQVPMQWKTACIIPVPKVAVPTQHSDFRPISITPVLTRIMERTVTSHFLYPSFIKAPPTLSLDDQYAFRPTGSTTAALIQLLNTITSMLVTNKFVVVLCLDFSKAFDTVRHSSLTEKLAQFDLPDNVYNWLAEYFNGHSHCTLYRGDLSSLLQITASII